MKNLISCILLAVLIQSFVQACIGYTEPVSGHTTDTKPGSYGIRGMAMKGNGPVLGVVGYTNSPSGRAVLGINWASSGPAVGTEGVSASPQGIGLKGVGLSKIGMSYGILGDSYSPKGVGILGRNNATSGDAIGILGISKSSEGTAIEGRTQDGTALRATAEGSSGTSVGVNAFVHSGIAVKAENAGDSGKGVYVGVGRFAQVVDSVAVYGQTYTLGRGYPGYFDGGKGIRIPVIEGDPSSPICDGTIWMNIVENRMKIRIGGKTFTLAVEE